MGYPEDKQMPQGLMGLDPELIKQWMAAQAASFTSPEQDRKSANKDAALALGFGLLQGRKGQELATIGQAGMGALQARGQSLHDAGQNRQQALQNAMGMGKLQQAMQAQQAQQAISQKAAGIFSNAPRLNNMGPGGPTPANAAAVAPPNQSEQWMQMAQLYAQAGDHASAKAYIDAANSLKAKYSTTPQMSRGPDGSLVPMLISDSGETKSLPYTPAERLRFGDTGGMAGVGQNEYTGKVEFGGLPKTMGPEAIASNKIAQGHLNIAQSAEKRAAEAAKQGAKPQWDSTAGMFVYPPSADNPAGRVAQPDGYQKMEKPLTESQAKATAFANQMSGATKILDDLKTGGFSGNTARQQTAIASAGAEGIPYVPGSAAIPRWASSDNAQKFDQATMQWTEAALRFMTGANAPEQEVRRNRATYFPMPGDSPAKVEQKELMRGEMEKSIRMAAGAGVKQLPAMPAASQKGAKLHSLADRIIAGGI